MTAKSLEEFNSQFEYKLWLEENKEIDLPQQSKPATIMSNIIFYFIIAAMIFAAFLYSQQSSKRNNIFGYSYFNILTNSMKSEMPAGTFILVKAVDPKSIKIGDDITFFQNESTVITHRVVDIFTDYEDSGQLGFMTKGTDNVAPDKDITYEANVIGKVIWHLPVLGFIFEYIANHVLVILVVFAVLVLLAFLLRILFGSDDHGKRKIRSADVSA